MDLAQILRELLRHRLWLVLGVLIAVAAGIMTGYRPSVSPPGLEKRAIELGAAQTRLVIDSPRSSIIDATRSLDPLIERAPVYAQLMSSAPILRRIAQNAGISPSLLNGAGADANAPGAEERSNQILEEKQGYILSFAVADEQPLITVASQAPTGAEAVALADAAAQTFAAYVKRQQIRQGVPPGRRVAARQLGTAQGGVLNPGVNIAAAVLVGIATFIGFCLLVLLVANVARNMRESRLLGDLAVADGTASFVSWADRRRASEESPEASSEDGGDDEPAVAGTASGRGLVRR